jgi:flagellar biosynthesis/type III secretory pathway chaperone
MELLSTLWSGILSLLIAVLMWVLKEKSADLKRLEILLSKTREEHARDYVTKSDVHNDINRVLARLDRLDEKLDAFMKEQRSALN